MTISSELPSIRVAVHQGQSVVYDVQANIAQVEKYATIAATTSATTQQQPCDLILFNELFLHGYELKHDHWLQLLQSTAVTVDGAVMQQIAAIAKRLSIAIAVGYAERASDSVIYNSVVLFDYRGRLVTNYRKTHVWYTDEHAAFSSGDLLGAVVDLPLQQRSNSNDSAEESINSSNSVRVSIIVCYDLEFPEPARVAALNGCQLLLVPTALTVPDFQTPLITLRARALENHVFVAYCNHVDKAALTVSSSNSNTHSNNDFIGLCALFAPSGGELARAPAAASVAALAASVSMPSDAEAQEHSSSVVLLLDSVNTVIAATMQLQLYVGAFAGCDYLNHRRPHLFEQIAMPNKY